MNNLCVCPNCYRAISALEREILESRRRLFDKLKCPYCNSDLETGKKISGSGYPTASSASSRALGHLGEEEDGDH